MVLDGFESVGVYTFLNRFLGVYMFFFVGFICCFEIVLYDFANFPYGLKLSQSSVLWS